MCMLGDKVNLCIISNIITLVFFIYLFKIHKNTGTPFIYKNT